MIWHAELVEVRTVPESRSRPPRYLDPFASPTAGTGTCPVWLVPREFRPVTAGGADEQDRHPAIGSDRTRSGRLAVSNRLVCQNGDSVAQGTGLNEAHGFGVAGLAEKALAASEHNREELQTQLVDEIVLN